MAVNEKDNEDVLLLHDDEGDINDLICDDIRKTRAGISSSGRIIKGTASVHKEQPKVVKRKTKTSQGVRPPKTAKLSFSESASQSSSNYDIEDLKDKMGISSMMESISSLASLVQSLAKKPNNVSESLSSGHEQINVQRQIIPLEPDFESNDTVDDFDINQSNASMSSPVFETSFDPALGFDEAFASQKDDKYNDKNEEWDIPQLQSEEKTSKKISENLAKAVNAALIKKSAAENLKSIEDKFFRPENCVNLTVPKVNREIWTHLPRQAHTMDSKMQEIQKYFVKGIIPIVQLAEECCKTKEPLDTKKVRSWLSNSLCLLGHGFLSLSLKRRSLLRPFFNEKFKPICNSDTPVDTNLFGGECMKRIKELGDYTKIPMCVGKSKPKYMNSNRQFSNKENLNYRSPVFGQGNRYPVVRGRGRGPQSYRSYPRSQGHQRGQSQRPSQ